MPVKTDATTASLLKSLGMVPGTKYEAISLTPLSFTAPEREWIENGLVRRASRPVFTFESALGPVSAYVLPDKGETLADAAERTLRHLGLDRDPAKWGPVIATVTVSRHRNLVVETPRAAKEVAGDAVMAALGL